MGGSLAAQGVIWITVCTNLRLAVQSLVWITVCTHLQLAVQGLVPTINWQGTLAWHRKLTFTPQPTDQSMRLELVNKLILQDVFQSDLGCPSDSNPESHVQPQSHTSTPDLCLDLAWSEGGNCEKAVGPCYARSFFKQP